MSNEHHEDLLRELGREMAEYQTAADLLDDAVSEALGMNRTDTRCFGILVLRGPMTAGQLADATGTSPGAMTTALDRLERAGFVRRTRDDEDRRRVVVEPIAEAARRYVDLHGPLKIEGAGESAAYTEGQLRLLLGFLRTNRALQERHAARIRAASRPHGVMGSVRAAAKDAAAQVKVAKAEVKAATAEVKAVAKEVKADLKAAIRDELDPRRRPGPRR
jgi:DNA-binding MarR family transcriptional regulator